MLRCDLEQESPYREQTEQFRMILVSAAGDVIERAGEAVRPEDIQLTLVESVEDVDIQDTPQHRPTDVAYTILSRHGAADLLMYGVLAEYMDRTLAEKLLEKHGDIKDVEVDPGSIEDMEMNVSRIFLWLSRLPRRTELCNFDLFQADLMLGHVVLQVISFILLDKDFAELVKDDEKKKTLIKIKPDKLHKAVTFMRAMLQESIENIGDRRGYKKNDGATKAEEISDEIQSRFLSRFQRALDRWAMLLEKRGEKYYLTPRDKEYIFGIKAGKRGKKEDTKLTQAKLYVKTLKAIAEYYIRKGILPKGTRQQKGRATQKTLSPVRPPRGVRGGRRRHAKARARVFEDPNQQQRAAQKEFRESLPQSVIDFYGVDNIPYEALIKAMLKGVGLEEFIERQKNLLSTTATQAAFEEALPHAEKIDPDSITPIDTITRLIGSDDFLRLISSTAPRSKETEVVLKGRLASYGIIVQPEQIILHILDPYRSSIQTDQDVDKPNPSLGAGLLFRAVGIHSEASLPSGFVELVRDINARAEILFRENIRAAVVNILQNTTQECLYGITHKELLDAILARLQFESNFAKEHQAVLVIKVPYVEDLVQRHILPVQVFYIAGDGTIKERKNLFYRYDARII